MLRGDLQDSLRKHEFWNLFHLGSLLVDFLRFLHTPERIHEPPNVEKRIWI
jgi:hypothetical protein